MSFIASLIFPKSASVDKVKNNITAEVKDLSYLLPPRLSLAFLPLAGSQFVASAASQPGGK